MTATAPTVRTSLALTAGAAALALAAVAAPASALPPGRLRTPGPVGTVDTVAGPSFCGQGPSRPDRASSRVGDVAADPSGRLWFQSGAPEAGVITRVASSTSVTTMGSGLDLSVRPRPGTRAAGRIPGSMLAADGTGGVLMATPTGIFRMGAGDVAIVSGARTSPPGEQGATADGRPLADARFGHIAALAADQSGNAFVADHLGSGKAAVAVRFLNRSDRPVTFYTGTPQEMSVAPGTVATIAGRGTPTGELVAEAPGLAVAGDRLYLSAAAGGARASAEVRLLNLGGDNLRAHGVTVAPAKTATVATVTGRAGAGGVAPGGGRDPAAGGIGADDQGNLFVAEPRNHRVRRIDGSGAATTLAGTGAPGFNGNAVPGAQARLNRPSDVAVGAGGRVYISDAGNSQVRFVDQAGVIHAALGNGATTHWACRAAGSVANRGGPVSLVSDERDNLYIAASLTGQVHRLTPSAGLRPVAGRPLLSCGEAAGCPSPDEAPAMTAGLENLAGLAAGPEDTFYVVQDDRVRLLNVGRRPVTVHGVEVGPGAVRTFLGRMAPEGAAAAPLPTPPTFTGEPGEFSEERVLEQLRRTAEHAFYRTAATDRRGNLLFAQSPGGQPDRGSIRQLTPAGAASVVVAQRESRPNGTADISGCCPDARDLLVDPSGNLYIADSGEWGTGRVWFLNRSQSRVVIHGVSVAPGAVEALAGAATGGSQEEGIPAVEAELSEPTGMALDPAGNLYVVDRRESTVHRVDASGALTTVAGIGQPGFNGDGLKGQLTALYQPVAVAFDACGNLLIADRGNDRVRRLNLVSSCSGAAAGIEPEGASGGGGAPRLISAALATLVVGGAVAGGLAVRRSRRRHRAPTRSHA